MYSLLQIKSRLINKTMLYAQMEGIRSKRYSSYTGLLQIKTFLLQLSKKKKKKKAPSLFEEAQYWMCLSVCGFHSTAVSQADGAVIIAELAHLSPLTYFSHPL